MTALPPPLTPLERAQAHVALGEWGAARDVLEPLRASAVADPPVAFALAEADLRTGHLDAGHQLLTGLVGGLARGRDAPYRRAVNMLGAAAFEMGRLDQAETCFQQALDLATAAADHLTAGRATNNLGMIAHIHGRFDLAISLYQLAVPAYQRLGYTAGLGETMHNLALAHRELGQLEQADRYERRAIQHAREAGNGRLLAIALVGRADLALRRGEAAVAHAGACQGATQYAAIPDLLGEADALRLAGAARTALGDFDAALESLDRAVSLAHQHGSALLEAEALETRARLQLRRESALRARTDAEAALALFRRLGDERVVALERWVGEIETEPADGPPPPRA